MSSEQLRRPGGEIPERLERETNACDSLILRRGNRTAPRDQRREDLLRAMGATA